MQPPRSSIDRSRPTCSVMADDSGSMVVAIEIGDVRTGRDLDAPLVRMRRPENARVREAQARTPDPAAFRLGRSTRRYRDPAFSAFR